MPITYKKILIFNPFGIGDVLFTTPLIRNLKENIKDVSIGYISSLRTFPLVKNNIFLDRVIMFEKDEWRQTLGDSKWEFIKKAFSFFALVQKGKFDLVFDLSMNSQYGFFLMAAGIKTRIGYNFKNRGRFLTHKIDIPRGYNEKHIADYYLDLLKFPKITPKAYKFDLFLTKDILDKSQLILNDNLIGNNDLLIGVCPGSGDSWGKTAYFKRWPEENFLKLCRLLQKNYKAKIILFGSRAETALCEYIFNNLGEKPINLCAKINLEEFCGILDSCKLIITNDGGPFHIAQALEKKVICFFGPADDKVYGAYSPSKNTIVLKKYPPCRPCYKKFHFNGCIVDKKCLREISVEEAFATAKELLR